MPSPELVIGHRKLETKFFSNHVQHTTFRSDDSQGEPLVKVVQTWYRGRELGRGISGTVFLEWSEKGECRAVKDIAKDKNSTIRIDYKRELMAMAVLAKHDALFVQLFGWYESDDYVHIAMEYVSHGDLRNYMEVERSESEAKVVIRQLLGGLVVIHREGFAHRDLKPENIFVVSKSPIWVKIGDFGMAKLAGTDTAFRTVGGTRSYVAPEMGIDTSRDTSEYTNAVDIWATGCITHELLTRVPPFRDFRELMSYCYRPEFPRKSLLSKGISQKGIEFVESALAYAPERRIAAKEALDSEWLRPECEGAVGLKTGESPAVLEGSTPILPAAMDGASGNSKVRFRAHVATIRAMAWDDGGWPGGPSPLGGRRNPILLDWPRARMSISWGERGEGPSVSRTRKRPWQPEHHHMEIDVGVEQMLEGVLQGIQETTSSLQRPMVGDGNAVWMLLNGEISMDIRDSAGNTPLHIVASGRGQISVAEDTSCHTVRTLVESGAPIDAQNDLGETALLIAVVASRSGMVKELLELGADLEVSDLGGYRPLAVAVMLNNMSIIELLLANGAYTGTIRVKLYRASSCQPGGPTPPEYRWPGVSVPMRTENPLSRAVINEQVAAAAQLLLAGADVGARDRTRRTALHHAVAKGSVPLVKFLLDHGASPDVVDASGQSPRREAERSNFPGMVGAFGCADVDSPEN